MAPFSLFGRKKAEEAPAATASAALPADAPASAAPAADAASDAGGAPSQADRLAFLTKLLTGLTVRVLVCVRGRGGWRWKESERAHMAFNHPPPLASFPSLLTHPSIHPFRPLLIPSSSPLSRPRPAPPTRASSTPPPPPRPAWPWTCGACAC